MFEQLFGSKTRVKLLSLFLNNPGRPYYVREITRKIDEQINSVRRELSNLLSIGIVKSDSTGNRLYYEANEKYQHYEPLRKIFGEIPIRSSKAMRETREEDIIARRLRSAGTVDLAFLSGAFVRDTRNPIDMLVVGDVNRPKVAKIILDLEKEMNRELNYAIMSPEDFEYRSNLNDRFLANVMESKKITIIDRGRPDTAAKDIEPDGQLVTVAIKPEVVDGN